METTIDFSEVKKYYSNCSIIRVHGYRTESHYWVEMSEGSPPQGPVDKPEGSPQEPAVCGESVTCGYNMRFAQDHSFFCSKLVASGSQLFIRIPM